MVLPPPVIDYESLTTLRLDTSENGFHLAVPAIVPRVELLMRLVAGSGFAIASLACAAFAVYAWLGPRPDADRAILAAFGVPLFALVAITLLRGFRRLAGAAGSQLHIQVQDQTLTVRSVVSSQQRTSSWPASEIDRIWFDHIGWTLGGHRLWRLVLQDADGRRHLAEFYWRQTDELSHVKSLLPKHLAFKPNYDPTPRPLKAILLFSPRNV